MKKLLKFLALVLSFLTTASIIGLAGAVKPEFKVNTQEMISFKNHISQSEFSKDYKVDDTCITKIIFYE